MIRILYRHRSGAIVMDLPPDQLKSALKEAQARLWIDMQDPTPEESQFILAQTFHFHPLAIDDAISESNLPKLDDYGAYLYVAFHTVTTGDERMDIHTNEVDAFLGPNFLLTMHDEPRASIEKLWDQERHQQNGLARGPAFLLYELIDRQLDSYVPLVDRFEEQLELLGDQIFRNGAREETKLLNDALTAKSSALRLTRILSPQRELLYKLAHNDYPTVPAEARLYFQDAYDHLARLAELAGSMRELAGSTIETHLTLVNNRINETMKVLTMISTIFIPLSFVAGIYGMNFEFMPELHSQWGYPTVWGIFLVIVGGMLYFFRRRGWI